MTDEELEKDHTLFSDRNANTRIWISKTTKINYTELYKLIAIANIKIVEGK